MLLRLFACGMLLLLAISAPGGDWPQFRGPNRDNISTETGLFRSWPAQGPKVLWKTPVCEGYAGAAIMDGRVYVNDYNAEKMPAVNVSLLDGQLAWRQHDGGHTDAPNVKHFIAWADRLLGGAAPR